MCSIFIIQQEHILQDILTYRHITEKSKKKWDWKNESYLGCLSLSLVKYFSRKTWTARNFSMWNQTTYSPQWDRRCTAKLSSIGFNSGCVFFFSGVEPDLQPWDKCSGYIPKLSEICLMFCFRGPGSSESSKQEGRIRGDVLSAKSGGFLQVFLFFLSKLSFPNWKRFQRLLSLKLANDSNS